MASVPLTPGRALARDPAAGVEIGWRTGFELPTGAAIGAPSGERSLALGDVVTGAVPFWIDAGYRLSRHTFVGADFEYARALVSTRQGCPIVGVGCSASQVLAGAQLHYHLAPDRAFDPWGGLGVGYEVLNVGTQLSGGSLTGFQVALHLGGDYKPTPSVSIGPFLMFALGAFLGCSNGSGASCKVDNVALHEWLTIGLRAAYDIHLGG